MVELFVMECMTVLGTTSLLLLLESKYSRRRTIFLLYSAMVLVMVAVAAIYMTAGVEFAVRLYTLVVHVPLLLLLLVVCPV